MAVYVQTNAWIVPTLLALFLVAASWLVFVYRPAHAKRRQLKDAPKLTSALSNRGMLEVAKVLTNSRDGLSETQLLIFFMIISPETLSQCLQALVEAGAICYDSQRGRYYSLVDGETIRLFDETIRKRVDKFWKSSGGPHYGPSPWPYT
jgi:hypothetical protein